jgi:hypothetical protein
MKKIALLLAVILLLGCFAGCDTGTENEAHGTQPTKNEQYGETLTQGQKDDILDAWRDNGWASFGGWMGEGGTGRYYGTESGYAILYIPNALQIASSITIGEYTFSHPAGFNLFAYRDKTFYTLVEIYEQGLISDDTIRAAWEKHNEIEAQLFPNPS